MKISSIMEALSDMPYDKAVAIFRHFGVSTISSREELTQAWRELVKKNHPDIGGSVENIKLINSAYDTLKKNFSPFASNDQFNKSYDRSSNRSYSTRQDEYPIWAQAGVQPGFRERGDIKTYNYSDLNFVKYDIWEKSFKSKIPWIVLAYDGKFFRTMFTVFGNENVFDRMARAMYRQNQQDGYSTRAIFTIEHNFDSCELLLLYLDGKDYSSRPEFISYEQYYDDEVPTPNCAPYNCQRFMRVLPEILDDISSGK